MQNWRFFKAKQLLSFLLTAALMLSLVSCANQPFTKDKDKYRSESGLSIGKNIVEVSPPETIQELRQGLEIYQPQVSIVGLKADEILDDNTITVKFQVKDLPIFKNPQLGLGPHLHVFLDNQPYQAVYDLSQPLVFSDLAAGTHTLRVFASRPWHESFKNEGAYAQTTFHVFTKTEENNPKVTQPLLTYSRPQGSYGAEPIMLDFYLTNAPSHLVAQKNPDDEIADWRIRCTVNGKTFIIDKWQPIYLQGFKPGKNWVKLELIDEQGNPLENIYNSTVRALDYQPNGQDTLSQLVRGELSVADARGIIDRTYTVKVPEPEISPTPETPVEETPAAEVPKATETPVTEEAEPEVTETPTPEPEVIPTPETKAEIEPEPEVTATPIPEPEVIPTPETKAEIEPEPEVTATPIPEPEVIPTPETKAEIEPEPEVTATPIPEPIIQEVSAPSGESLAQTKSVTLPTQEEKFPLETTLPQPSEKPKKLNFRKLLERFELPGYKKVNSEPSLPIIPLETVTPELKLPVEVSPETPATAMETEVQDKNSLNKTEETAEETVPVE
ncbi:hypothetical protein NIES2119_21585 [[Phormidium ambiguum] IAM M-71]|uniref:FHA domain-containing protein n=1 Tax=[Phormidium ambiguum] IAM M-71 TaxID=454136 RepID=A0A1U7IBZ0_9CYAN|nr:hypothetical protein [Phormidium ambiguum]OKH34095.1 hypothetical protein NIES2119_21585 [Phormidium ambiguum IAM M-71]